MNNIIKISLVFVSILFYNSNVNAQNGTITIKKDPQINELLKLKKTLNEDEKSSRNYKIQIFSGDMATAKNYINKYKINFEDWKSSLVYESPNYKVWVGDFRTSLEADRALKNIKKEFDGAFIFKTKQEKKR